MSNLVAIGSKVPKETYDRLRWLAYVSNSTVSAIVAEYVERCIAEEDFSRYQPPDRLSLIKAWIPRLYRLT